MRPCCRAVPAAPLGALRLEAAPAEPGDAPDRETGILLELAREGEGRVAFSGLKRRLALHPQILTRALGRLLDDGLVARDDAGYALTEAGHARLAGRPLPRRGGETLALAQLLLPPGVAAEAAAERLAGRWFRDLRWFGRSDGPGEATLTWLADGAAVRVRLVGGAVLVEAEAPPGAEPPWAAVRPLLAAVADLYGLPGGTGTLPEAAREAVRVAG